MTIPVVYGLLDQSLDTQFVKINKSYLANENNANFAPINDCTQFEYIVAVLEEYSQNNVLIGSDTLDINNEIYSWLNALVKRFEVKIFDFS